MLVLKKWLAVAGSIWSVRWMLQPVITQLCTLAEAGAAPNAAAAAATASAAVATAVNLATSLPAGPPEGLQEASLRVIRYLLYVK